VGSRPRSTKSASRVRASAAFSVLPSWAASPWSADRRGSRSRPCGRGASPCARGCACPSGPRPRRPRAPSARGRPRARRRPSASRPSSAAPTSSPSASWSFGGSGLSGSSIAVATFAAGTLFMVDPPVLVLVELGLDAPNGSRSERTRREDRRSKFYQVSDNLQRGPVATHQASRRARDVVGGKPQERTLLADADADAGDADGCRCRWS
jgi:hypothetical protein